MNHETYGLSYDGATLIPKHFSAVGVIPISVVQLGLQEMGNELQYDLLAAVTSLYPLETIPINLFEIMEEEFHTRG